MSDELHPILDVANKAFREDENGEWHLNLYGGLAIEGAILEHLQDPELPEVLGTLFGLILVLEEDKKSPRAALALTVLLGRMEPHLRHLRDHASVENLADRQTKKLKAKAQKVLGSKDGAVEKLSGPPPEGAISVRQLDRPPMPRPSGRGAQKR